MAADDAPASSSGGGITATLTRKVGPAPLWVYGVVAAVAAFLYIRHSSSSAATPDQAADAGTAADSADDDDDADEIASDTADDLEDNGDFTPPADTTSMPSPPDVTATPKAPPTPGPKGNTSPKLRVVSVTKADATVPKFLAKYGVSLAQLRKDNPGRTWKATEKLKPGDKIHVPLKAA